MVWMQTLTPDRWVNLPLSEPAHSENLQLEFGQGSQMRETWKVREGGRTAVFTGLKCDATIGSTPIIGM